MEQVRINNFNELVNFITDNDLTIEQMNTLIQTTLGLMVITSTTKDEVLKHLHLFWKDYGNKPRTERPLFLDVDISLCDD
jgi:hypothetical protein